MDEGRGFGDSLTGSSMLSMDLGATVAMGNAGPEIKAVSKYVTKSNEELGVAYAIDRLLDRQGAAALSPGSGSRRREGRKMRQREHAWGGAQR